MSAEDVHKILLPNLYAAALAAASFLVAGLLAWRHGKRMKQEDGE